MASSSLSQESLDREDVSSSAVRRSRPRTQRGSRTAYGSSSKVESPDDQRIGAESSLGRRPGQAYGQSCRSEGGGECNGEAVSGLGQASFISPLPCHINLRGPIGAGGDHESPSRVRAKEKRIWQSGAVTSGSHAQHKGVKSVAPPAKDKRKLREKRRSSGLIHAQSTESSGDSIDETDLLTLKSTTCREVIDADNPQTPEEDSKPFTVKTGRCKSPSDLDADFEDNQDYDSTVSQSDSKLPTFNPIFTDQSFPDKVIGSVDSISQKSATGVGPVDLSELRQMLADERRKNKLLREALESRDNSIVELERKVAILLKGRPC